MKKILLVKKPYRFFPIGLAHVITALRKNGVPYDFLDMDFQRFDWRRNLQQGQYAAVGIGGLYADFNYIADFAKEAKQLSPQTPFILGGNMTSDISMDVLFSHMPLDYAVIGEGEKTLPELLRAMDKSNKDAQFVKSIVYRSENGKPIATARRKPLNLKHEDLYPTWDDVEIEYHLSAGYPGYEKFTAMPVLTGRGCTGRCIFCSPTNGRYRMRPIDQVISELIRLDEKYDFTGFAFLNEIMYPTEKMMHAFLHAYKQTGINKPWIACLRVDIGINLLRAMKDAGCIGANCGIESGNDRVLKQMKKNITVQQVKDFYRNCRKVGLTAQGAIMFGNETETQEELVQTIDLMIHEDIHSIGGALLISYPGTEVYKRALANGQIEDEYQYLKNLDFSDISFQGTFRNVQYLNVSNMADDVLFRTMAKQACRHRTYNYYKYSALDIDLIKCKGRCAVCGEPVDMQLDAQCMLNCVSHCGRCYSPVYFNFYELEPFKQHAVALKQRFAQSNRIAVYGTGPNARFLHFHDIFWLDLDKLAWFVDETGDWKGGHFFNGKVIRIQDLSDQEHDLVLIADSVSPAYARTNLCNAGIPANQIVPMQPSQWYDYIFGLYARQHQCA
jgi:radical SAM superfamily enzyme YgiQ (UPF0313 family)